MQKTRAYVRVLRTRILMPPVLLVFSLLACSCATKRVWVDEKAMESDEKASLQQDRKHVLRSLDQARKAYEQATNTYATLMPQFYVQPLAEPKRISYMVWRDEMETRYAEQSRLGGQLLEQAEEAVAALTQISDAYTRSVELRAWRAMGDSDDRARTEGFVDDRITVLDLLLTGEEPKAQQLAEEKGLLDTFQELIRIREEVGAQAAGVQFAEIRKVFERSQSDFGSEWDSFFEFTDKQDRSMAKRQESVLNEAEKLSRRWIGFQSELSFVVNKFIEHESAVFDPAFLPPAPRQLVAWLDYFREFPSPAEYLWSCHDVQKPRGVQNVSGQDGFEAVDVKKIIGVAESGRYYRPQLLRRPAIILPGGAQRFMPIQYIGRFAYFLETELRQPEPVFNLVSSRSRVDLNAKTVSDYSIEDCFSWAVQRMQRNPGVLVGFPKVGELRQIIKDGHHFAWKKLTACANATLAGDDLAPAFSSYSHPEYGLDDTVGGVWEPCLQSNQKTRPGMYRSEQYIFYAGGGFLSKGKTDVFRLAMDPSYTAMDAGFRPVLADFGNKTALPFFFKVPRLSNDRIQRLIQAIDSRYYLASQKLEVLRLMQNACPYAMRGQFMRGVAVYRYQLMKVEKLETAARVAVYAAQRRGSSFLQSSEFQKYAPYYPYRRFLAAWAQNNRRNALKAGCRRFAALVGPPSMPGEILFEHPAWNYEELVSVDYKTGGINEDGRVEILFKSHDDYYTTVKLYFRFRNGVPYLWKIGQANLKRIKNPW